MSLTAGSVAWPAMASDVSAISTVRRCDVAALRRAAGRAGLDRGRVVDVVPEAPSTNARRSPRRADDPDADGSGADRGAPDRRPWPARPHLDGTAAVRADACRRWSGRRRRRRSWPWIPLLAGLAVAATVRQRGDVEAALKWPNDVVVDDRKLAGLLVERVEAGAGPAAVIGIGLNVSLRADELRLPTPRRWLIEGRRPPTARVLARSSCAPSTAC